MICVNCKKEISELESFVYQKHSVCGSCLQRLTAPPAVERKLGMTWGETWVVGILGIVLAPALVGIPLLVWAWIAQRQFRESRNRKPPELLPPAVSAVHFHRGIQRPKYRTQ